ncbi:hypothetical protein [Bradyrhizobium sp. USDA 4473]
MQVLTPSGYKSAASLARGDEVCAFDAATGAPIINHVENIEPVDYAEWCRWWSIEETVPPFAWYRINGSLLLFREQSVWRNGLGVCHARDLVVGDVIYDDADHPVTIATIEEIEDNSLIWYRFDIDGDHSYIVDSLTVHNASRFWVGGTGTWDLSATTHWASSTGGSSGASAPGSADAVTFDGSSGGGTVTPNFGGTGTFQSIVWGGFSSGTIDFSVNNNNVTLSASSFALNGNGTATRTFRMGNGTWSLTTTTSGVTAVWAINQSTGLTFNANGSTIVFSGNAPSGSAPRELFSVGLTYNNITFSGAGCHMIGQAANNITFNLVTIGPKASLILSATNNFNFGALVTTGTASSPSGLFSDTPTSQATVTITSGTQTFSNIALRDIAFTGGATFNATNAFDLGNNSGTTITAPSGGGAGMIGC